MCAWLLVVGLVLAACAAPKPRIEWFRSGSGAPLVLSPGNHAIAVVEGDEVRVHEYNSGERLLARGTGVLVGEPTERDALVIDRANERERSVRWLRRTERAAISLEPGEWQYLGGVTDHARRRASLLFGGTESAVLVELDAAKLVVRGTTTVQGTECAIAGGAATFVVCRAPITDDIPLAPSGLEIDRWIVSRYDGVVQTWSGVLDVVDSRRGNAVQACATGDGSALVIAWGMEAPRRGFTLFQSIVVETSRGEVVKRVGRADTIGQLYRLVPVPERAAVMELYRSQNGITIFDAQRGTYDDIVRWPYDPADAMPLGVTIRRDGAFVFGGYRRALRRRRRRESGVPVRRAVRSSSAIMRSARATRSGCRASP